MKATANRASSSSNGLKQAWDLLRRVGELYEETVRLVLPAKSEHTVRQWLARQSNALDAEDGLTALVIALSLAADLETFTPSHTGTVAIDRLARQRKRDAEPDVAYGVLRQARFTPFVMVKPLGDDLYLARNLVTEQTFTLLDDQVPRAALDVSLVARLCALGDGLYGAVGMMTPLHPDGVAVAMQFVRPGKGITSDHRCAAAVYRHVVRHGGPLIPGLNQPPETEDDVAEPSPLDLFAAGVAGSGQGVDAVPGVLDAVRRLASVDSILESLYKASVATLGLPAVYRRFAEVQIEALHLRSLAGSGTDRAPLDALSQAIDREIGLHRYPREAADLFREIRRVVTAIKPKQDQEDLTHVIERIRGLRAKTIDQGCTEQEALAAADKVAELLDRYGLSLGEIDLRQQACQGFGIESTRKRSGALDECLSSIAQFCDCRAWNETSEAGTIRSVFFGLPADVEAARYLYERVAMAFQTETAAFQKSHIYEEAGGGRAKSTRSFQWGLAGGIRTKLLQRKAERTETSIKASGRDLVPVKESVVEEELAKLGLNLTSKSQRGRMVLVDAFKAGEAAAQRFEAEIELQRSPDPDAAPTASGHGLRLR